MLISLIALIFFQSPVWAAGTSSLKTGELFEDQSGNGAIIHSISRLVTHQTGIKSFPAGDTQITSPITRSSSADVASSGSSISTSALGECEEGTNLTITGNVGYAEPGTGDDSLVIVRTQNTSCSTSTIESVQDAGEGVYAAASATLRPLRRARVELWAKGYEGYDPWPFATITDSDGDFQFCLTNNNSSQEFDLYVVVLTCADPTDDGDACGSLTGTPYDYSVTVTATDDYIYWIDGYNSSVDDVCTGTISWDIVDQRLQVNGAEHIYDLLAKDAYDYLADEAGWNNTYKLHVRFPDTGTGLSTPDEIMHVAAGDELYSDLLFRIYGNFVLYHLYDLSFPQHETGCPGHGWGLDTDPGCALIYGWTYFLQAAIQNNPLYEYSINPAIDLEIPLPAVSGSGDEGAVSATFWDILDANVEDWDALSRNFTDTWNILATKPEDICAFYTGFQEQYSPGQDLDSIFEHHNVDCCSIDLTIPEEKFPLSPGDTATVKATAIVPEGESLQWEITPGPKSEARAVIEPDNDQGKTARITDVEGQGWMVIKVTNPAVAGCEDEYWLYIGCMCDGPGEGVCSRPGGKVISLSSIDMQLSLGRSERGVPAGNIFLQADQPDPLNATPQALEVHSFGHDLEILSDSNGLRQVVAPDAFVDIVVNDAYSYTLTFYALADKGSKSGGYYTVDAGATPIATWTIENPDSSDFVYNRLRMTEDKEGRITVYEYEWDDNEGRWSLSKGNGLQILTRQEEVIGDTRVVTEITKDNSGTIAAKTKTTYKNIVCIDSFREEIIETMDDPDGFALTTTTNWYEDPADAGSCGKTMSQVNPDGSWVKYEYDSQGRKILEIRSWLDAPFSSAAESARAVYYDYSAQDASDSQAAEDARLPRKVTEKILGNTVSEAYYVYTHEADGSRIEISEQVATPGAAYGVPGNLRSTAEYYPFSDGAADSWRIKSLTHPDGTKDTYTYEYGTYTPNADPTQPGTFTVGAGTDIQERVKHGTISSSWGIAYKSTGEINISNERGELLEQRTYVSTGGGYYAQIDWTVQTYDQFGRVLMTNHANGSRTDSTWDCCGKSSEIDSLGISRLFTYDDLSRLETETKEAASNIITAYTYDAAGRRVARNTSAGGLSQAESSVYDGAGRLIQSTDSAGLVTSYSYAAGGLIAMVTRPGGATEITERFLDGRIKSVTGTAVIPRYYSYGVNGDCSQWTRVDTQSPASPMWKKSTVDMLGRTIQVEKPGFSGTETTENFYNDLGQLIKTTSPGLADTLYTYDEIGNQIQSGLDLDDNGVLDLASLDRISETQTVFSQYSSNWWQETVQKVYAGENDGTVTVVSTSRNRLTGLGSGGLTGEAVSIDILGNQTVATEVIDRAAVTSTRTTDYPDSTIDAVSVSINGLLTSVTGMTGITMSYAYDPLERQIGVSDPRTGTTITHYDARGWVDYIQDPAGNQTQYTYEAETGRRIVETNALGKAVRFSYNDRGQVIRTWGDAVYPVEYIYDVYGRMAEMHTYRQEAGWSGETWPGAAAGTDVTIWHYQESTGLLIAKEDDAGQETSYTYGAAGRLASRTWARTDGGTPLVTTYGYDPQTGELLSVDYSDTTPDLAFTYDRLGRQVTVSDAVGTRTFAYNDSLQPSSETITGLFDKVISRSYETSGIIGRPAGFNTGADYAITYGYDTFGRFANLGWNVNGVAHTASYAYLGDSDLLQQISTDDGLQTSYTYEAKRDLRTSIRNSFNSSLISQYDYVYDPLGRRASVVNSGQAFTATSQAFNLYGYNDRSELIDSARYLGTDPADTTNPVQGEYRAYAYDPIGNRTTNQEGTDSGSYTTNDLNQYVVQVPPQGTTRNFSYDEDGNLTRISEGTAARLYTFNGENRLAAVQPEVPAEGDKKVEFTYDYMGRRVNKKVSSFNAGSWLLTSDFFFLYDGWNLISEWPANGAASKAKYYVWGLDLSQSLQGAGGVGGLIATLGTMAGDFNSDGDVDGSDLLQLINDPSRLDAAEFDAHFSQAGQAAGGVFSYYALYDGNGNVGQIVNGLNGAIGSHYEYDPYGNVVASYGEMAADNPFRFSTKYCDDETGLYYYGYRYYAAELGRWLSRDPIGEVDGSNYYSFVSNDGINFYDTFGLWKWKNDKRQGKSRATVIAELCGDPYKNLALLVGLDENEVNQWLQEYKDNDKVMPDDEFTVPNTFIIGKGKVRNVYMHSSKKTIKNISNKFKDYLLEKEIDSHINQISRAFKDRGFLVLVYSSDNGTPKTHVINSLQDNNTWGYALFGHGSGGVLFWTNEDSSMIGSWDLRTNFKYGLGINGHCFAYDGDWNEKSLNSFQAWGLYYPLLPPLEYGSSWETLIGQSAGSTGNAESSGEVIPVMF